ncbi:AcrR family transcriptional regulator [Clostridium beijerinckii]|uniref:AcrR family transcriptional regulator n=2 Tax=Clostridium beijerinckii TaxID=1520 RepID=A0A7Y9A199_CLOBE|nr:MULTISPECIES: TetR family transcriptional regulator [Clostridium]ABR35721.1 transcriptional regulator, TetR family [Clostridium beijerinckii NCIMB 8052]AIU03652.1 TetR family transcriptional regulator [Clostridium beijerinckii ATCC 35702]MBA2885739.1 AcrR family transcriptional regulator [Clostridium beijerinckii]MBA2900560.1 AcrR family transcriptional regulator [Clostridium beijerinckii]MBA2910298.1 AcrR family transcriptional regulator [Clostridium beijerinckii]
MDKISLDKETILNATEEIIRRFGPDKANITDVAKLLKVSHAAIYRYYNGKTDLWNAVTERWLTRLHAPSNNILKEDSPADVKLSNLLESFVEAKHHSAINDPEMFANYIKLAQRSMEVIKKGIEEGINSIEKVIVQGITEGIFFTESPYQEARSVYLATSVFIHPNTFEDPDRKQNIESVINLLIKGLKNSNK